MHEFKGVGPWPVLHFGYLLQDDTAGFRPDHETGAKMFVYSKAAPTSHLAISVLSVPSAFMDWIAADILSRSSVSD